MNQQLFLEMIDAAINGKTIDLSEVDEEFIKVAKEQTFLPFLYVASKDKKYKKYYIQSFLIHERINEVGKLIDDILNEAKIPHIFLKGYELQNLYPDSNLRMMGDIDLIVKPEDFDKAKNKLQENSFQILDDDLHHLHIKKNNIEIELHHNLFGRNKTWMAFFSEPFKNAQIDNEYKYKLNYDFLYSYILAHFANHIEFQGEGIRPIIDLYLIQKHTPISYEILFNLNLKKFNNMLESLFLIIFKDKKYEIKNDKYQIFLNSLINYGIHGNNLDMYATQFSNQNKKKKFSYLVSKIFLPYKVLIKTYPLAKIIITIPFIYLYRFFSLLFKKRKSIKQVIIKKENNEYLEMIESIDIDKLF